MGLAQQCARPMVVHNEIIEKELEAVEGTQYVTKESILRRAQEIKGIPLRDVDKTGRLATGKGAIGTVIEESWFGYTPNSESEPDFPEAGVELKVTPYLRGKNGIRAKERLVCNIILIKIAYPRKIRKNIKDLRKSNFQIVRLYSQKICAIMLVETYLTEINDIHQCSPPGAFINKSRMGIHPHGCLSGIKAYR